MPAKKKTVVKKKTKALLPKKTVSKKTAIKKTVAAKKKPQNKKVKTVKKGQVAKKKTVKVKKVAVKKKGVVKKVSVKKAPAKKTLAKKAPVKKNVTKKLAAAKKPMKKKQTIKTEQEQAQPTRATKVTQPIREVKVKRVASQSPKTIEPPVTSVGLGTMGVTPYREKSEEDYMNDAQRAHFETILQNWKQSLMQEVDSTITHMKDEAANFADPADRASQEEGFSLELRTRDRERKLIKKIEETIEKIKNNDYGFCDLCGVEIGVRRLEARPTANLCIDCKTLDEIKERQTKI